MEKDFWEKISDNYDEEIHDVLKSDQKSIVTAHINRIASKQKTVGDIGCAIGKWLPLLSGLFKEVHAIDISQSNIDYAKTNHGHLKNIRFRQMDMTVNPKTKYSFDVIVCVNAILIPDYEKRQVFFKNLNRFLKPKGNLVLVVPAFESYLFSEFIIDRSNRKENIADDEIKGKISKAEHFAFKLGAAKLEQTPTKHYLEEELITTLGDFGFTNINVEKVEYSWDKEVHDLPNKPLGLYPWDWLVTAVKK